MRLVNKPILSPLGDFFKTHALNRFATAYSSPIFQHAMGS